MTELEQFDWVAARNECSAVKMFLCLRHDVEQDVTKAKALFQPSHRVFDFKQQGDTFTVFEGLRPIRTVTFSLDDSRTFIVVEQDNGDGQSKTFRVALTLNKDKQCRFLLDDEELESWELRKKALESLLFLIPTTRARVS